VLVVDDDPVLSDLARICLELEGFLVATVPDGDAALTAVRADPPDLVLLDVMMPGLSGLDVVRALRADAATVALPVVLLTARGLTADKVVGLTAGADDYIVKPFDPAELVARIRTTLRRTADARAVSPLTGLPGNVRIELASRARASSGAPYAVSHVDLDEFKSFNDRYGFLRGDQLLLALAGCLVEAAAGQEPPVFVGHVGGDDFVVLSSPEQAEPLARDVAARFDAVVPSHYDPDDVARGALLLTDRRGELREHPLVSVSIGVAWSGAGDGDHRAVVAAAGEMKRFAKRHPGSFVAVDRRTPPSDLPD
jgi:diguanylate cyclase (GGDEF)-like protein